MLNNYAQFLLTLQNHTKIVESELFWEALHLRPLVSSLLYNLVQNKKWDESGALQTILALVKTKFKKDFFVGLDSVVDFVLWCDLYGIVNSPGILWLS